MTDPAGVPAGVYTQVTWDLGSLAAGASVDIKYRAGIPQRANVASFPGGAPTPASGDQGSNLDNNTGPSTRETAAEQSLTNRAAVSGTYSGPVVVGTSPTVTDTATQTVTSEDLDLVKSVTPTSFRQGGVATYTLTVRSSEYADASGIVITDHLPNGLCPLDTTENYAPGSPAPCGPGAGFGQTGATFSNVVANADGTFDITFTPVADAHDGTVTVTFKARMRARTTAALGRPDVVRRRLRQHRGAHRHDERARRRRRAGPGRPADGLTTTPRPRSPATPPVWTSGSSRRSRRTPARARPPTTSTSLTRPRANVTFAEGDRVCFLIRVDFSDVELDQERGRHRLLAAGCHLRGRLGNGDRATTR